MKIQRNILKLILLTSLSSLTLFSNLSYADDPFAAFKELVEDIQKDLGENNQNNTKTNQNQNQDTKPIDKNKPKQPIQILVVIFVIMPMKFIKLRLNLQRLAVMHGTRLSKPWLILQIMI